MPRDENELIKPAVEGTLRVLGAATKSEVKRVIMTSSFAAIGYSHYSYATPLTEANWTDVKDKNVTAYTKSKTLAEKAAWDFVQNEGDKLELTTICPRYILGPALGKRMTTSLNAFKGLLDGSTRAFPNFAYGIVDVRDVADLHLRAIESPNAPGERFIVSVGQPMTFKEMGEVVSKKRSSIAGKVSSNLYPNWVVRMAAWFNPMAKGIAPHLGKILTSDNSKAERLLGWQARSPEEAILASVDSILAIEGNHLNA